MKKLVLLCLVLLAVFSACEEDPVIYDNINGKTLAKFETSAINFPIPFEGDFIVDIPISVSTISSNERTVSVSVVEDQTDLSSDNYSFNPQVTIPANSYEGTLRVTGYNESLVLGEINSLVLEISSFSEENVSLSSDTITLSAFLNCPFDLESFVGTYAANEAGYCDGCYNIEVVLGEDPNTLIISNLWEVGGQTTLTLEPENDNKIDFIFGEFLYVNSQYGNAFTYNPSAVSGDAADDISSFRTCDNYIDLWFRVCVDAGCFGLQNVQMTKL